MTRCWSARATTLSVVVAETTSSGWARATTRPQVGTALTPSAARLETMSFPATLVMTCSMATREVTRSSVGPITIGFWVGNVRELQNYAERALVLMRDGEFTPDLLPPHVRGLAPVRIGRTRSGGADKVAEELVTLGLTDYADDPKPYEKVMALIERELLAQMLRRCQGVQIKAAEKLGINRNTLHKKVTDYGLDNSSS